MYHKKIVSIGKKLKVRKFKQLSHSQALGIWYWKSSMETTPPSLWFLEKVTVLRFLLSRVKVKGVKWIIVPCLAGGNDSATCLKMLVMRFCRCAITCVSEFASAFCGTIEISRYYYSRSLWVMIPVKHTPPPCAELEKEWISTYHHYRVSSESLYRLINLYIVTFTLRLISKGPLYVYFTDYLIDFCAIMLCFLFEIFVLNNFRARFYIPYSRKLLIFCALVIRIICIEMRAPTISYAYIQRCVYVRTICAWSVLAGRYRLTCINLELF